MMSGKSLLNPYATPYVPMSKIFSGKSFEVEDKATKDLLVVNQNINRTADSQVTCSFPGDDGTHGYEKAYVSKESSPKMAYRTSGSEDVSCQDGELVEEKPSDMDDHNVLMKTLSSMFPNISIESLADLFDANQGDLHETINMLEQLEDEGDCSGELPETLEFGTDLVPSSEKASSSGTSNPI